MPVATTSIEQLKKMSAFPPDAMMQEVGPLVLIQQRGKAGPVAPNPKLHEFMSRTVEVEGRRPVARQVLSLMLGVDDGLVIPLGATDPTGELVVGRAEDAPVRVQDPSVSAYHARVRWDAWQRQGWLRDLDSTNGTLVNGKPVKGEVELHEGDTVTIGDDTAFLFLKTDTLYALLKQR